MDGALSNLMGYSWRKAEGLFWASANSQPLARRRSQQSRSYGFRGTPANRFVYRNSFYRPHFDLRKQFQFVLASFWRVALAATGLAALPDCPNDPANLGNGTVPTKTNRPG